MSTRKETIAALLDALPLPLTAKPMFGEYGLYLDGRVVALICDDRLYLKNLPEARAHLPEVELAPPYPGAKPHIAADEALDAPEPVMAALRALALVVPPPKPKKKAKP